MPKVDARQLVFLDESGVNTNMSRRYARSAVGQRANDGIPLNTGKSTTILSSVRLDGTTVPIFFAGAVNREKFKEYLKDHLVPTLKPGDIVIMDNLRTHKVDGVAELIQSAGAFPVYLPPYSPDLNPIEEMWSKIKAYLRKVKARTSGALEKAIVDAFACISVSDIFGWFSHSGYSYS
jgi:transposase